jgi:bifunctional non-homologous end joining protein LigD
MPLTWAQVKADLDPHRFTTRTVPALLSRSKPWEDYCGERPLEQAIKRLGKVEAGSVSVGSPSRQHTRFNLEAGAQNE